MSEEKQAVNSREEALRTEQMWRGGALAGGGLATLAILWDQLRSQRRKQKAIDGGSDTIDFTLPPPPKMAAIGEIAGAAAMGGLSYYGLSKLYQMWRRKKLDEEIAQADAGHTAALQNKVAEDSKPFTFGDYAHDAPGEIMFLAALAAGAGTYGLLEHTFPKVGEKPTPGLPKRIRIKGYGSVMADGAGDGMLAQLDKAKGTQAVKEEMAAEEAEEAAPSFARRMQDKLPSFPAFLKAASIEIPVGVEDYKYAAEMLTMVLSELPELKLANSALISLVAAHHQNPKALETTLKEAGALAAVETSKGGWKIFERLSQLDKRAAVHAAYASRTLAPTLASLAIAELLEVNPDMAKRAQVVAADPAHSALMTKFAALLYQTGTLQLDEQDLEKSAATQDMNDDMRRQLGTLGLSESVDAGGEMDESDQAYQDQSDPIDAFMAGKGV